MLSYGCAYVCEGGGCWKGHQLSQQMCSRWKATGDLRRKRLEYYSNSKDYMVLTGGQAPERVQGEENRKGVQSTRGREDSETVSVSLHSFSINGAMCVYERAQERVH